MRDLIGITAIITMFVLAMVILIVGGYNSKSANNNVILCKKIYTTELKTDSEIKQICDDVTIPLSEVDKIGSK